MKKYLFLLPLLFLGCGGGGGETGTLNPSPISFHVTSNILRSNYCENYSEHKINGTTFTFRGGGCGDRGINVSVLDAHGNLLIQASFDTYSSSDRDLDLITFLETLQAGEIILCSVTDEGSVGLSAPSRVRIMEILGSTTIDRLAFRNGWSMISVIGKGKIDEARGGGSRVSASAVCYTPGDCF